jgi:hypothetical protein
MNNTVLVLGNSGSANMAVLKLASGAGTAQARSAAVIGKPGQTNTDTIRRI